MHTDLLGPRSMPPISASGPTTPPWLRRAFDGLSSQAVGLAFAMAAILTMLDRTNQMLMMIWHGDGGRWLYFTTMDYAFQVAIVATMLAFVLPVMNLGPRSGRFRYAALAVAISLAALVSACVRMDYLMYSGNHPRGMNWGQFGGTYLWPMWRRYALLGTMLTAVAEFHRRETRSIEDMHQAELDRMTLDREMSEARLQVLQAQIEPHFLFNTLANVRRLYQTDLGAGRTMLDHLMHYFEVALPRMRDTVSTLAREAALIDAYLSIQQIRMGRRLSYEIDIPEALHATAVPPMMLLTLVENAIKHGLNPLLAGGEIRIVARREGTVLSLMVIDNGAGFGSTTSGSGTGLANIRARLAAAYGEAASLSLSANLPRGVQAALTLPVPDAIEARLAA